MSWSVLKPHLDALHESGGVRYVLLAAKGPTITAALYQISYGKWSLVSRGISVQGDEIELASLKSGKVAIGALDTVGGFIDTLCSGWGC
jgi:hypothetical protein